MSGLKEQGDLFWRCSLIKKLRVEFLTRFLMFLKFVVAKIVYTWWQSVATDGGVWTEHPHTSHFLVFALHVITVSHVTLAQGVVAHVIPSMCHAPVVFDFSSTLHFVLFTVSLIFYFILLIFHLHSHLQCGSVRREVPCATSRMRSLTLLSKTHLSQKHDDVTASTSTGRPVCGSESTKRCVLTPAHVEEDQTSTVRPVFVDQKEEHEIDFRVQDCHMQLWKEQNISEFKSLYKGSKIILIEKHFKPTCSRITSTTHSATIRKRWSWNGQCRVIRVVRSKTKSAMFSLYSLLESRNCVLHLRTMLGWQRIQKKV